MTTSFIASTSQVLWRILEAAGVDPAKVFASAGLDTRLWNEPDARFSDTKLAQAWAEAVALTKNPCLGLRAAQYVNPASLHALGFAWLVSDSLHDGLARLVRYSDLLSDGVDFELSTSQKECRLTANRVRLHPTALAARMDAFWASLIALSRITVAVDLAPVSLALNRPEPPCSAQFFALFRAPIEFSAPKDSIVFDRETAERPLPTSNRVLARANEQVVADYLARFQSTDLSGRVRTRLIELLPLGNCNESQLADALNLSRRTLQRRLAEAGTSYSVLLDEARQQLAIRFIGEQRLSIKETSYLLGFSEPGNFSRAFKRWTGQAPSNFRGRATG